MTRSAPAGPARDERRGATTILEAALGKARETGCAPLAVAVLDAGGRLKAFAREDGAGIVRPQSPPSWGRWGSPGTSSDKDEACALGGITAAALVGDPGA
ncbi:MAG TPA: heme-binding protein [Methylomirabilota bacterium]